MDRKALNHSAKREKKAADEHNPPPCDACTVEVRVYRHLLCPTRERRLFDENICKSAKKGLTPSTIGVILRDSHGIAQVKSVTCSKILRILKAHGSDSLFLQV
ncbi:conserved hypothetical protein [Ricinus communis]|uniref:Small ribosomal subunit protein uS15 N-terminal domain-containing protein n=1 Tax=Ricinus communis TaxID=3988 RepID=B9S8U6_RICCO|nr:conserved hypothetical protein [Ricinus communis]